MSWLVTPSGDNVFKPLGLAASIKLIRLVGLLAEALSARDGNPVPSGKVAKLLDRFVTNPAADGNLLDPVIGEIGLKTDEVAALWDKFRHLGAADQGKILDVLSRRFGELAGQDYTASREIRWKFLSADIDGSKAISKEAQLSLAAGSQASLEIQALAPLPNSPFVNPASGKAVLRLGFDGRLSVAGKLGFSSGMVSGRFSGAAQGETAADFYFLQNPKDYFGVASAERLRELLEKSTGGDCSLFEVENLSNLLGGGGLHCLQLAADSTLSFEGEIGLAKAFEDGGFKFKTGITAGFTAKESGKFDYLFAAGNVGGEKVISIHIKRNRDSDRTESEAFGVELDPGDVAKKLQMIIDGQLGDASAVIDQIKEMLPGPDSLPNLLAKAIDRELANSPFKDDLKTIVGLNGKAKPEEALRNRIIGAIETAADGWSEHTDVAASSIAREVTHALRWLNPYLPNLQADIEKAVKAALDERIKALKEKVASRVQDTQVYQQLAASLNAVGVVVSGGVAAGQARVDEATRGIFELFDRVQRTINRMRSLAAAAAEKKITLRLIAERHKLKQEGLDLRFDLYPKRPGAQDALDAILTGEMGKVMELIGKYRQSPDKASDNAPIIAIAGGYDVYEAISDSRKGELVLFDLNFSATSIISADVRWTVDLAGNVSAVSSAEFTHVDQWRRERQMVAFVETSEILFAQKKSSIHLGLTVSHEDEKLTVEDTKAFLQGLVVRELLPASSIAKAQELLADRGDRKATKGRLDVGLSFTPQQLQNWLDRVVPKRVDSPVNFDKPKSRLPAVVSDDEPGYAWILHTVSETMAKVMEALPSDEVQLKRIKALINKLRLDGGLAGAIRAMTPAMAASYPVEIREEGRFGPPEEFSILEYRRHGATALYEIATLMKALWEDGQGIPASPDGIPVAVPIWTRERLKNQQYRIAQLMSLWWLWGGAKEALTPLLSGRMRTLTVALLESMVQLGKGADGSTPALWATLSLPDADGNLVPRLLTQRVASPG